MAGGTRSHSPPLPPNATYNHPTIALNILPSAKLYVAGSKLTGMLEVVCKEKNVVALGQLAIEFFGTEELKLLDHSAQSSIHGPHKCIFQGPALPPSNAVVTSEAPIGGHYYTALRGRTKFPFSFPLPSKLPSSTDFDGKARVSYALKATCQVLSIQSRQNVLVTKSRVIRIVERMLDWTESKYHEPVEVRGELRETSSSGAGVWAEVKVDKMLHYNQDSSSPDDGLIRAHLMVKNHSRRTLNGGVNAKICRRLVLPNDPPSLNDASRIQVVRNCTFRGIDYEFPSIPSQAKTVKLICQLPSSSPDDTENSDNNIFCISARGMKLFSIDMFLRVELELGALSNDLVVDLPIFVSHPSSLPKELLVRNTPLTIEHVPSLKPSSTSRLSEPQASGRISHNTSRPSSPHPPSLQPGNISRAASPRSSLSTGGDWGMGVSCPPSPAQSARFSPLPSPRHSPLPSARFSSPLPFSSSPSNPSHPFPSTLPAAPFASPSISWPNTQPASHPPEQIASANMCGFSTYPYQYNNPQYAIESQPVFSPPTTPWRRQTSSTPSPFDPNAACASSMTQPGGAYPSLIQSNDPILPLSTHQHHPHPILYSQEPLNPSTYQGVDIGSAMRSPWRIRHQSLPTPPAPSQYHLNDSLNQYHGQERAMDWPESSQKHVNSRRISEPISNYPVQASASPHSTSGGMMIRKRALPTPPQMCEVSESSSDETLHHQHGSSNNIQDQQQNSVPPPSDQPRPSQHARLETIGELGESQPGTLNNTQTRDILSSLAPSAEPEDSGEDDAQRPQLWKPTRVVSQPRGMRPRRSDGSDSVQALEDMVSKEDERRSAGGAEARDSAFDQTPTRSNKQDDDYSNQTSSRSKRNSLSPHPHSSDQAAHPTGLANLVHLLKRATSAEPPRASSAHESLSHGSNASLENNAYETVSSHPSHDNLARSSTPNYTGSALRNKSTRISYGEIDAVPSLSPHAHKASLESDRSLTPDVNKSEWKPPSTLASLSFQPTRTSIVEQINLCDEQPSDEVPARESIAPEALFPQFQPERHTPLVNGRENSKPENSPNELPPPSTKSLTHATFSSQPPVHIAPLLIPSDSPLVKKKSSKPSRQSSQSMQKTPVHEPHLSSSHDQLDSASHSRPSLSDIPSNTSLLSQTTIVERLRSQHGLVTEKKSSEQRTSGKDRSTFEIPQQSNQAQHGSRDQSKLNLVDNKNELSYRQNHTSKPPSSLPQSVFKPAPVQNELLPTLPSPNKSNPSSLPLSSAPRLSAIPRSSNPLLLDDSSCYASSSHSIPHRPLPISPNANHNLAPSTFDSATLCSRGPLQPAQVSITNNLNLPTRALFSSKPMQTSPKETDLELIPSSYTNHRGGHLKASSLDANCSPNSSIHLSRKSRIKRQVSSTNTANEYLSLSTVGTERGRGDGLLTINRVPGGWNEEESNEIEAQLIEALNETNRAVQKATSKRLSTPQFLQSPTLSRTLIFPNVAASGQGENMKRSSRIERDRFRASMSIVETPGSRSGTRDLSHSMIEEPEARGAPDVSSIPHTDFDEDTPIRLTSGEHKSMRGGRGGRVSSVVGQWAKLTSIEDGAGMSSGRMQGDTLQSAINKRSLDETIPANNNNNLLISTRGISIKPKKVEHTPSYSIAGFLSRNSSLTSHPSSSKPKIDINVERRTLPRDAHIKENVIAEQKLGSRESTIKNSPSQTPRKASPRGMSTSQMIDRKRESNVAVGYRNLANRLSGVPANSNNSMTKSASSSSSASSISSLTSSLNNLSSSDNELHLFKKLNNNHNLRSNNRIGVIGGADRNKHNSIHAGFPVGSTISDLVKRWET